MNILQFTFYVRYFVMYMVIVHKFFICVIYYCYNLYLEIYFTSRLKCFIYMCIQLY